MECPEFARQRDLRPVWALWRDGQQTASRRLRRLKRFGMKLLAITALLTWVSTALAQSLVPSSVYTVPQHLVAIDGSRRLNLYCIGSGQPVVMLEAGSGNGMITWRHVQADIGRLTRVCAYDRAGLGFSDTATRPSTEPNIVDDLHRLIESAGIATPMVFVGHSLGGEVGLLYAATYPDEIAGAVLVDPGFPDMLRVLQAALPPTQQTALLDGFHRMLASDRACLALAQAGALTHPSTQAAKSCVVMSGSSDKLDATLRKATAEQLALPRVWRAMISENESFVPNGDQPSADSAELTAAHLSFDDKPLIVLTRGNQEGAPGIPAASIAAMEAAWKAGHDRIAGLSTRGVSEIVPHTGHYIQVDQPRAVIDAVRRVLMQLRHS
jgi:pimeloyl-ACP methyl ester carboxylesterase